MKENKIRVSIIELEDKKGFYELSAETQAEAVMSICPKELRMQVLENALITLTNNE